jgi:hypothetical protein
MKGEVIDFYALLTAIHVTPAVLQAGERSSDRGSTLASARAGLAPGASGADGAYGAREQRTGDAGSSCSGIQCALRIRRGEQRGHRLRDAVVEPCRVCRLERLRVRHVPCKHRRVEFHRRICASEPVPHATAIHAQLTLGHVRVLKRLRRRGGRVDFHCLVCTSASAPSAAAACTRPTLGRQLELGHGPHAPARLRKGLPRTHASRPTRLRAPAQARMRAAGLRERLHQHALPATEENAYHSHPWMWTAQGRARAWTPAAGLRKQRSVLYHFDRPFAVPRCDIPLRGMGCDATHSSLCFACEHVIRCRLNGFDHLLMLMGGNLAALGADVTWRSVLRSTL